MLKRLLTLLCVLALLMGSTGCMCTYIALNAAKEATKTPEPTEPPTAFLPFGESDGVHPEVSFSDMVYERPDIEALTAQMNALSEDIARGGDAEELLKRYAQVQTLYNQADSEMSLAYVLYAMDVTVPEYKDEYGNLVTALNELDLLMTDISIAMLASDTAGEKAKAAWGEAYVDAVYAGEALNSPEIQELIKEDQELTFAYDELYSTMKVTVDGRDWTIEELAPAYYAGEITFEEYSQIYNDYFESFNAQAGAIFLKLLPLRAETAKRLGFGSYAAYAYETYNRDYTLNEIQSFQAAVKEYIVPLYVEAVGLNVETYLLSEMSFDRDSCLAKLQRITADFSPKVNEALNYMLRNHLYDFEVNPDKMEGSFTTYFANYAAPYIFSQWEGGKSDVGTIIHELGHFSNYYHNAPVGWSVFDPLDLAEVDSQGLELLLIPYYDSFYRGNVDAAVREQLINGLYAITTGCLEDEFQQELYAHPDMTLPEINALYLRLAEEYGMKELYDYTGNEWVAVHHTFQSPLYYISYATSMMLSMQLYELSNTDYDAAQTAYERILMRPAYSAFRTVAASNGLSDPIAEETVRSLSEFLAGKLLDGD